MNEINKVQLGIPHVFVGKLIYYSKNDVRLSIFDEVSKRPSGGGAYSFFEFLQS